MGPKEVLDLIVVRNNAYPSQPLSGTPKDNLIIAAQQAIYLKKLDIQISKKKIAIQLKSQIRKIRPLTCPEKQIEELQREPLVPVLHIMHHG